MGGRKRTAVTDLWNSWEEIQRKKAAAVAADKGAENDGSDRSSGFSQESGEEIGKAPKNDSPWSLETKIIERRRIGEERKTPKAAQSWGEVLREWPKVTICIVSNEFCERFSFYGMRTLLALYLLNVLGFDNASATMIFNGFAVFCYLTPLLGSVVADGYIGKFKTICLLSLLYSAGQILLALASSLPIGATLHPSLDLFGLIIICIGTGGIKPCVCSFGGDQFEPHQEKMLALFFSAFYFSINAGSVISTFTLPLIRVTPCLGQDSCYPLAFGIPALLMVAATVLFLAGSSWYKKPKPEGNPFSEAVQVTKTAISNRWRRNSSKFSNVGRGFFESYLETHQCANDQKCLSLQQKHGDLNVCQKSQFIVELKAFLRLLIMFVPAPMFWALNDQQATRWLIQSLLMDCRLWKGAQLLPDQMNFINPLLIILLIPLFHVAIYPLFALRFKITPLRKMVAGGLIATVAFLFSAAVQLQVNPALPIEPRPGHSFVSVLNANNLSATVRVITEDGTPGEFRQFPANQTFSAIIAEEAFELPAGPHRWSIIIGEEEENKMKGNGAKRTERGGELLPGAAYLLVLLDVGEEGTASQKQRGELETLLLPISLKKPTEGIRAFSLGITIAFEDLDYRGNLALCRRPDSSNNNNNNKFPCDPSKKEDFYSWIGGGAQSESFSRSLPASLYQFKTIRSGDWALYLLGDLQLDAVQEMSKEQLSPLLTETGVELEIESQGGVYMLILTGEKAKPEKRLFQSVADNSVNILWQVPQITIMTTAEVLFSVTGYEFAYSQAPPSMKSIAQAFWLLTTALGDALIVLITMFRFSDMAVEFLFYAGSMFVLTLVLALLAIFYYEYKYYKDERGIDDERGNLRGKIAKDEWNPIRTNKSVVKMYGSGDEIDNNRHARI